jgi:hypothetical protein
MSEMIERGARAILAEGGFTQDAEAMDFARRYARAVIEAIREPTPEMLEASRMFQRVCDQPEMIWTVMIDEILHGQMSHEKAPQ